MKCKYCNYEGPIFALWQHITYKRICNDKYTPDEIIEFEQIYEAHKKEKRKISRANYIEKNKKLKTVQVNMFEYAQVSLVFFF